jgi:hypothetical protein
MAIRSDRERSRGDNLFAIVTAAVLLLSLGLAIVAGRAVVTGEPNSYHSQHLRLLAQSLGMVFLSSGQLLLWKHGFQDFPKVGWIFPVLACCALIWAVLLMRP